jgi:hypothetical protein
MSFMELRYTVCGLTFVGETQQLLHRRMNAHMYDKNNSHYKVMAYRFSLPDHCIVYIKAQNL